MDCSTLSTASSTRTACESAGNVAVIGAGNTAIDCATIAKRLGAERVTMVYRRSEREMTAYPHEYRVHQERGRRVPFPHAASSRSDDEWRSVRS